ncbi:MAG: hypothetical protein JO296_09065 [Pseudonocardiales bacterium]|nr:hypothetical protein [Pseudonocardiales bacterium]
MRRTDKHRATSEKGPRGQTTGTAYEDRPATDGPTDRCAAGYRDWRRLAVRNARSATAEPGD